MPGRGRVRVERGCDLVVGEVVPVAQDDGRTLRRRQSVGELAEILVRRSPVFVRYLGQLFGRPRTTMRVDGDSLGDGEHPAAKILRITQAPVRGQSPQERLLERVLGTLGSEALPQHAEHDAAVLRIERLERWNRGHIGI